MFPFRKQKLYEIVRGEVGGQKIAYLLTRPLPQRRAAEEFRRAVDEGRPSGSIIVVA